MDYLITNISNLIKNSPIDIKALNEFLKKKENGGNYFITIKEDGQIVNEQKNPSFLDIIIEKLNSAINFILKLLRIIKEEEEQFCSLMNISNNCYLNAGLQILSRCDPLFWTLFNIKYEENELLKLFVNSMAMILFSKNKQYNPIKFIKCFCKNNKEFVFGKQNCSQNFIRTILRNINGITKRIKHYEGYYPGNPNELSAYKTYIKENNIFPESEVYSLFSGMLKMTLEGECTMCGQKILNYTFNSFVDHTIYLDSISTRCSFSDVLRKNIGEEKKSTMKCQKCKGKISLRIVSKFVKIPDIFIFTLERYLVRNKVPVEPDDVIDIHDYVDKYLLDANEEHYKYELFAINIRIGRDRSFGHEICQIKEKDKWYTIDDNVSYPRQREFNDFSYGLFYRKIK